MLPAHTGKKGVLEVPSYRERVVQNPEILVGKPTIRGTRISVELVLAKLAQDLDLDDLFAAYPRLTREDVMACLDFARMRVAKTRRAKHPAPERETANAPAE